MNTILLYRGQGLFSDANLYIYIVSQMTRTRADVSRGLIDTKSEGDRQEPSTCTLKG
jgi:hypothetical protein